MDIVSELNLMMMMILISNDYSVISTKIFSTNSR